MDQVVRIHPNPITGIRLVDVSHPQASTSD